MNLHAMKHIHPPGTLTLGGGLVSKYNKKLGKKGWKKGGKKGKGKKGKGNLVFRWGKAPKSRGKKGSKLKLKM